MGGDHARVWQNCGIYADPVPNETAVHSLEHGAVWITYGAIDSSQLRTLTALAEKRTQVLLSPFPGLPHPVVATAWGVQAEFDSADDAGIAAFIQIFEFGPQAPRPDASCMGGHGNPGGRGQRDR